MGTKKSKKFDLEKYAREKEPKQANHRPIMDLQDPSEPVPQEKPDKPVSTPPRTTAQQTDEKEIKKETEECEEAQDSAREKERDAQETPADSSCNRMREKMQSDSKQDKKRSERAGNKNKEKPKRLSKKQQTQCIFALEERLSGLERREEKNERQLLNIDTHHNTTEENLRSQLKTAGGLFVKMLSAYDALLYTEKVLCSKVDTLYSTVQQLETKQQQGKNKAEAESKQLSLIQKRNAELEKTNAELQKELQTAQQGSDYWTKYVADESYAEVQTVRKQLGEIEQEKNQGVYRYRVDRLREEVEKFLQDLDEEYIRRNR